MPAGMQNPVTKFTSRIFLFSIEGLRKMSRNLEILTRNPPIGKMIPGLIAVLFFEALFLLSYSVDRLFDFSDFFDRFSVLL